MITILIGLVVLILLLWGLGLFTKADPKGLALGARRAGGVAALVGAAVLLFRGNFAFALPLGITGFGLLGWGPWPGLARALGVPRNGTRSRYRSYARPDHRGTAGGNVARRAGRAGGDCDAQRSGRGKPQPTGSLS